MKILYVTSECKPFTPAGLLSEVGLRLPASLAAGAECAVVLPLYTNTISAEERESFDFLGNFFVTVGWRSQYCGIFKAVRGEITYYFIDNEYYFKRDYGMYGYYDDAERYAFFCRAVLEMIQFLELEIDILHSNDWQTALVPVYFNIFYRYHHNMRGIHNIFSIHDAAVQGKYGFDLMEDVLGIPRYMGDIVDYDGMVNFTKGAIEVADAVVAVSPACARALADEAHPSGLGRILAKKIDKTFGFLGGIDQSAHNPATDKKIFASFTPEDKTGKAECKRDLLSAVDMPADGGPVIALLGELTKEKGAGVLLPVLEEVLDLGYRLIILGHGEPDYQDVFYEAGERRPGSLKFLCGTNTEVETKLFSGADMWLLPALAETDHRAVMQAMRYGTIPVASGTCVLCDIVDDGETGFVFEAGDPQALLTKLAAAAAAFEDKAAWAKLVTRAMNAECGWDKTAQQYLELYQGLLTS